MSQPEFPPINPYQAPAPAPVSMAIDPRAAEQKVKIKKFRDQIHALGALWIILGGIGLASGLFLLTVRAGEVEDSTILAGILIVTGSCWFGLGVATCMKQLWAVYVGLALSYLSLLGNLVKFNVCSLILLVVVILQAHRVIGWAKELRAMGIPLDTKP